MKTQLSKFVNNDWETILKEYDEELYDLLFESRLVQYSDYNVVFRHLNYELFLSSMKKTSSEFRYDLKLNPELINNQDYIVDVFRNINKEKLKSIIKICRL